MPHEPGHTNENKNQTSMEQQVSAAAPYKVYGTNQPYTGRVLQIGNRMYTTSGGALEGHSKVVVANTSNVDSVGGEVATPYVQPQGGMAQINSSNPVTETFLAPGTPRYYRPNGSLVPVGAPLHRHQDGTVMTEHSMGPNDNSVVVTLAPPSNGQLMGGGSSGLPGGVVPADPDVIPIQPPSPDRNTGGNTGGNMGGGGSY